MTAEEEETARKIVEGWYWQPSEGHRYRFAHAIDGMVLYKDLAPTEADMVELVTGYILSRTGVKRLIINNKLHTYPDGWDTKDCWFATTPGDKFDGSDAEKIRLYWALVKPGSAAANGDGPYSVENGCQYAVTHEFYWDVRSLPTPPQSTSGVSYTLQGVTRNRETGYFSCVIEKRERVKQTITEYLSEATAYQETREQQHLGVKQGSSAGPAAGCSDGTIVVRKERKNEDCTRDIVVTKTTEIPVEGASVVKTGVRLGTLETVENRSMAAKAPDGNLAPGESVANEVTPGKRWNQKIVRLVRAAVVKMRESCRKTIFAHVHVKVNNHEADPGFTHVVSAGNGKIVEKSVQRMDEGFEETEEVTQEMAVRDAVVETVRSIRAVTKSVTHRSVADAPAAGELAPGERLAVSKTDGGRLNVVKMTMTPADVGQVLGEQCERSQGRHVHSVTRSLAERPEAEEPAAGVNETKTRVVRKTDENTFDVTDQTTKHAPSSVTVEGGSGVMHERRRVGVNQPAPFSGSGGVNVEVSNSASPNDHGSFSCEQTIRSHLPKTFTGKAENQGVSDEIEVGVNHDGPVTAAAGQNEEVTVSLSPNGHGSVTYQKHKRRFSVRTASGGSETALESVSEVVKIDASSPETRSGNNVFVSNRPNGHGTFDTTRKIVRPKEVDSGWIVWQAKVYKGITHERNTGIQKDVFVLYSCGVRVFRNLKRPPPISGTYDYHMSISINQYGLYDGTITYRDYRETVYA